MYTFVVTMWNLHLQNSKSNWLHATTIHNSSIQQLCTQLTAIAITISLIYRFTKRNAIMSMQNVHREEQFKVAIDALEISTTYS